MNDVEEHDDYFVQKRNAANVLGLSCFQKVTATMRMLTYGTAADAADEYVRIGESTTLESLRHFGRAVVDLYEDEYLRQPNEADTARLLGMGEKKGYPEMLGSIDCMHWVWKNCPYEKQGQYKGHVDKATIILEVVASEDLCFSTTGRVSLGFSGGEIGFPGNARRKQTHRARPRVRFGDGIRRADNWTRGTKFWQVKNFGERE